MCGTLLGMPCVLYVLLERQHDAAGAGDLGCLSLRIDYFAEMRWRALDEGISQLSTVFQDGFAVEVRTACLTATYHLSTMCVRVQFTRFVCVQFTRFVCSSHDTRINMIENSLGAWDSSSGDQDTC